MWKNTVLLKLLMIDWLFDSMKCETIYIALIGLVLAACNGDVFVDDYLPHGAATVLMSEDNRTAEITFTSDNWGIENIEGWTGEFKAYTSDGKENFSAS